MWGGWECEHRWVMVRVEGSDAVRGIGRKVSGWVEMCNRVAGRRDGPAMGK